MPGSVSSTPDLSAVQGRAGTASAAGCCGHVVGSLLGNKPVSFSSSGSHSCHLQTGAGVGVRRIGTIFPCDLLVPSGRARAGSSTLDFHSVRNTGCVSIELLRTQPKAQSSSGEMEGELEVPCLWVWPLPRGQLADQRQCLSCHNAWFLMYAFTEFKKKIQFLCLLCCISLTYHI